MSHNPPPASAGPPSGSYGPSSSNGSGVPGRRSSYASVVAGAPSTSLPLTRSGGLSQLMNQAPPLPALSHPYGTIDSTRPTSRVMDPEGNADGGAAAAAAAAAAMRAEAKQQAFGRHVRMWPGLSGSAPDEFLTPSYLRTSRYVERLAEAHRAKLAKRRDAPSIQTPTGGSLSTSSSSVNLHKLAPSHRGMTYDIIEKETPGDASALTPLPSCWNEKDKFAGMFLAGEGLEARFTRPGITQEPIEAAAVRADHPMPIQCGLYYYEVCILSQGRDGWVIDRAVRISSCQTPSLTRSIRTIGVGFSSSRASLARLPGWEGQSWAYHGDDGKSFCCSSQGREYGPRFGMGDVIGCGVNFRTASAFFTKNGVMLGTAFRDVPRSKHLFPSVGMKRPGEHVRANFGQTTFVFDIDRMVAEEKQELDAEIQSTSLSWLRIPLGDEALLQRFVVQYLKHEGYIETAGAFTREARAQAEALRGPEGSRGMESDPKSDIDALNRQRIRAAILEGDIDKAFKYTSVYYPNVLKDNEQIYFRLRCRKFIEMIRRCSELHLMAQRSSNQKSKQHTNGYGKTGDDENEADEEEEEEEDDEDDGDDGISEAEDDDEHGADVFENGMELDEPMEDARETNGHSNRNGDGHDDIWEDDMETDASNAAMKHYHLLQETIKYGQVLQSEFRDDHRKEVKKALEETFSLLAYEDPQSSVVAHLLDPSGRAPVAADLNSAILVSLGKSPVSAIEQVIKQTDVMLTDVSEEGGRGALINVRTDYLQS
ncbi:MAG: hypothetical protein M1823_000870 [Watsoniomyces obsoletus]|nr:MAG: hypothetical protein M1823_000870 [Watsoniomyces obsoletus]